MKEAKNELLQFVGGVIMLVVGLYILSQKVRVLLIMGWQVLIRSYYGTINNWSCMDVCFRWLICI